MSIIAIQAQLGSGVTYACQTHKHQYVLGPCPKCQEAAQATPQTASKNDQQKADLSHLTKVFMEEVARAMMVGEKKYARYNYCKGHKVSQLIAAIIRHAVAYNEGEENDPIDGQSHLGSIGANVNMLLRQRELGTLIDDRFKKES